MVTSGSNNAEIKNNDLTRVLKGNAALKSFNKRLESTKKSGLTLPKPLEKTAANRVNIIIILKFKTKLIKI